jgi:hypothetical protein
LTTDLLKHPARPRRAVVGNLTAKATDYRGEQVRYCHLDRNREIDPVALGHDGESAQGRYDIDCHRSFLLPGGVPDRWHLCSIVSIPYGLG